MNLMKGMIKDSAIHLGKISLPLPSGLEGRGRRVIVGARPEHLGVCLQSETPSLPATVEVVERLGSEAYLYLRIPGVDGVEIGERSFELRGAFVARVDPWSPLRERDEVRVTLDPATMHIFEEDGQRARSNQ
jgi:ABC-type sugar transport system ATPase subunit